MGRDANSILPATTAFPAMNNMVGIFRKAIKDLLENKKLMLEVFLLILTPFWLLVLFHTLLVGPLIGKVEDGYETSSLSRQDLVSLVLLEIPFMLAFGLVLLFGSVISISSLASTHHGSSLQLKEIILRIRSTWKKTMITGLFISLLMIAIISLIIIAFNLNPLMGVLVAISFPYLALICNLGLVISTVEDDVSGTKSVFRAQELVKQSKLQGYFLMLILLLLNFPIYLMFYVMSTDDDDRIGLITQFVFLLVSTVLFCLAFSFDNLVCTLFYLELKSGYQLLHAVDFTHS